MDTSINNISFKANLVTKVKGRNGFVEKVAKRFSEKTAGLPGTMQLYRGGCEYPGAMILDVNGKIFSMTDYAQLTHQHSNKVNKTEVETMTTKLSRIFRMLTAEDTYVKKQDEIDEAIRQTSLALKNNLRILKGHEAESNEKYIKIYNTLIQKNKARIQALKADKEASKAEFWDKLDKITSKTSEFDWFVAFLKDIV